MLLNDAQVKKIAKLANLNLSDDELAIHSSQLSGIFNWINQLMEVNVDGAKPMVSAAEDISNIRDDVDISTNSVEELMVCAPKQKYHYYVVPKVVE